MGLSECCDAILSRNCTTCIQTARGLVGLLVKHPSTWRVANTKTEASSSRVESYRCCLFVCLFVLVFFFVFGCLTPQQRASVSQGWICSDNFTCCHTEIEVANQTSYLTQSQYTDTGPTSPSADPIMPDAWQGSHWSANFKVTGISRPEKSRGKRDSNSGSSAPEADPSTTRRS